MEEKSKVISGLKTKKRHRFSDLEKHQILHDYFTSGLSKQDIWEKYNGNKKEHGALLKWMRQLGYEVESENAIIVPKIELMPNIKEKAEESFEILQLKKRIEQLEKQLKDSEMKAIAYSTMIDVAEKKLKVSIRKKHNTKSSKK